MGSGAGHLPHMPAYADTEYEYFEQRGGLIRPTMTAGGGMMGTGVGMVGHHQLYPSVGEANPHLALGGQLLPAQTAKLDNRQEEVRLSDSKSHRNLYFQWMLMITMNWDSQCFKLLCRAVEAKFFNIHIKNVKIAKNLKQIKIFSKDVIIKIVKK